jgi:hypothetical protein
VSPAGFVIAAARNNVAFPQVAEHLDQIAVHLAAADIHPLGNPVSHSHHELPFRRADDGRRGDEVARLCA